MLSVALIGVDGAGKTTLANRLLASFPLPMKYIYMGTSILSSNLTLPTSRLILHLKLRAYRKSVGQPHNPLPETLSNHDLEYREVKRGRLAATARMLNRMAEECYRQLMAWRYQRRGFIVVYDRHFIFEYTPTAHNTDQRLSDRIHLWFLAHVYPQPDLVIFLDAPLKVLLSRKNECPPDHLRHHRQAIRQQAKVMDNLVTIDASQPLERVQKEVIEHIAHRLAQRYPHVQLTQALEKL